MPSGKAVGAEGTEGAPSTEEDLALARRRYIEYQRLAGEGLSPEEAIPKLPMDGGTILRCGETRFQHVMNEGCQNLDEWNKTCQRPLQGGTFCVLKKGHSNKTPCRSEEGAREQREFQRKRRQAARQSALV